jgi:hypothetical protein
MCGDFIGEEDSADLRSPATEGLRKHLNTLANDALHLPLRSGAQYGYAEEDASWGIGPDSPVRGTEELLKLIDRGTYEGGPTGRELFTPLVPCSKSVGRRNVDTGPNRWYKRIPTRRAICDRTCPHCRLESSVWYHGMS